MRITKKEAEALFSQGLLADEMSWRIEKAMTRVCTCLESVEQTVSELEKNLPAQQGFFSGKCDMRAYYPIVCDCLMRIERQSGTLREALIELTSVEAFVAERREEGLRAEALLLEAGERAYAEGLLQDRERVRALLAQERERADRLQRFSKETLACFYRQALELADAKGNGKDLRVSALKQLCGNFVFSVRTLMKETVGQR